jgi:hypothetical protein
MMLFAGCYSMIGAPEKQKARRTLPDLDSHGGANASDADRLFSLIYGEVLFLHCDRQLPLSPCLIQGVPTPVTSGGGTSHVTLALEKGNPLARR